MNKPYSHFLHGNYHLHPTLLGEPLPQSLSFEVTNHCNLSCTHCGHSQYPDFEKGYLDESLFDKVRDLLGPEKIASVNLSDFGEPFMSKGWWKIFDKAKVISGIGIGFITNGLLIDRHLDKLDCAGLNISISLDGASETTYSYFRGEGNFSKLVDNLRLMHERVLAGTLPRSDRSFIVVLSQINVHEMPLIVELASQLGVGSVVFSFQVFFDHARFRRESLFFAKDRFDQYVQEAASRANSLGVGLIHPGAFDENVRAKLAGMPRLWLWRDPRGMLRCGAIGSNCYVKFHGQVEACCVPDRYPLGDLNNDAFLDIWHGSYYRRLRQSFACGTWTSGCMNCNLFQSVDPNLERSHSIPLARDDGGLVPLPQPYRATQLDRRYRDLIDGMARGVHPRSIMPELRHLLTVDDRLHEVANALGVAWMAIQQVDKGLSMLEYALRLAPEDPIVAHNRREATHARNPSS